MHSSVHVFNITFFYLQDGLSSARVYNCQFCAALSVNEVIVDEELQRKDCMADLMPASTGKSASLYLFRESLRCSKRCCVLVVCTIHCRVICENALAQLVDGASILRQCIEQKRVT